MIDFWPCRFGSSPLGTAISADKAGTPQSFAIGVCMTLFSYPRFRLEIQHQSGVMVLRGAMDRPILSPDTAAWKEVKPIERFLEGQIPLKSPNRAVSLKCADTPLSDGQGEPETASP